MRQILLFIILIIVTAGLNDLNAQKYKNYKFKQKMQHAFNYKSTLVVDPKTGEYKPDFRSNGGEKVENFFNQGKVKKEAKFIEDLKIQKELDKQYAKLNETIEITEKSGMDDELSDAILELNAGLDKLQKKLNNLKNVDLVDLELNKMRLEILTEMNDLKKRLTDPLNILAVKSKYLNTIKADFSFETGKSELTKSGKSQLDKILEDIYSDIDEWFYYLDDHNEAVFRDDKFVVHVVIRGYTDEQGYSTAKTKYDRLKLNQKLSDDRAYAVKDEINKKFNKNYKNLNITLSSDYMGMGEDLPPNVYKGPEDDPKRRICTVGTLVGPKSLIKVK